MSWRAVGQFACDGCKVITSAEIEVPADNLQPVAPSKWLRVETSERNGDLDVVGVSHYCPGCAPLIRSYLKGRVP
jgi:hypothetical protein